MINRYTKQKQFAWILLISGIEEMKLKEEFKSDIHQIRKKEEKKNIHKNFKNDCIKRIILGVNIIKFSYHFMYIFLIFFHDYVYFQ